MRTHKSHNQHPGKGVIGLLTVIVIGALVLAGGITVAFVGQSQIIHAGDVDAEHFTRMIASSCIEEAAHRLKLDSGYTGGTVPLGANTCTVTVSGSGSTRTITAAATWDVYTKTIQATFTEQENGVGNAKGWTVSAWQESDPP